MDSNILARILRHLHASGGLVLFLDYDGTLVPIARTPTEAQPDDALLALLADLARAPAFDTILLSGRPLASLQGMLPVPGLTLAGTYGVEIQRDGKVMTRGVDAFQIRPIVEQVKSEWGRLTDGRDGFLLEDKGLAIALHARWAEPAEAGLVLETARAAAMLVLPADNFRILRGDRFLETYYAKYWYNIYEIRDKEDGNLKGWYCNVAYPAEISEELIAFSDLALDLVVYPDGRQVVLDEEEFQALKGLGATDAEIVEALGVMELFAGFNKFLDSLHVDIDFPRRGA